MPSQMPWFPFYAQDFTNSRAVRCMTPEAVGIYTLMLAHEWDAGPLPADAPGIARILGVDEMTIHRVWPMVSPCFARSGDGLVNDRLEEVRCEQIAKAERLSRAGKTAAALKKARRQ